jgi:hypothetical protein
MYGSEIQFYMTQSDEKDFADFLFSHLNALILRDIWYETKEVEFYRDTESFLHQPIKKGLHNSASWCIWCRDIGEYSLHRFMSLGKYYYEVDHTSSPIIEFSRSIEEDNVIQEGRLAYISKYYDEKDRLINKDQRLTKIFEMMRRWVKKEGLKATWDGEKIILNNYIFPGAKRAFLEGSYLDSKRVQVVPLGCKPHIYNNPDSTACSFPGPNIIDTSDSDWAKKI